MISRRFAAGKATVGAVRVSKRGVIDYPLYEGQALGGVWRIEENPVGPVVHPGDGFLRYQEGQRPGFDESVGVSIATPLETARGALLLFRVRANTVQGDEVALSLAADVALRFTGDGTVAWQRRVGGAFRTLAPSAVRPGSSWHDVVMAFSPGRVAVFEDGDRLFDVAAPVEPEVTPRFDLRVRIPGSRVSLDVGEIYAVPSTFEPGVDTPWDYAFRANVTPASEAMAIRRLEGGPVPTFGDGYVRFSAAPSHVPGAETALELHEPAPAVAVVCVPVRVNASGGRETTLAFPGGNLLSVVDGGTRAFWHDGTSSVHLAASGIAAGAPEPTVVTLVMSATSVSVLENGGLRFRRRYPAAAPGWRIGVGVRHVDGDLSVDLGGVRVLPSIKPPELLAVDLRDRLLGYFPLKGALNNAAGNSADLIAVEGEPAYTPGPCGVAADFSGGGSVLAFPRLAAVMAQSYTLSVWVRVNAHPPAGSTTAIAGTLLLDAEGRLEYRFLYNDQRVYQDRAFRSARPLAPGTWHHVAVTFGHDEARLGIYVDGAIDSIHYLDEGAVSASAILPSTWHVGGYKPGHDHPFTRLDGGVGDLMILDRHVHPPSVEMLATLAPATRSRAFPPLPVPVFMLVLVVLLAVGVNQRIEEQTQPQAPDLDEIVRRIRAIVGVPARTGARVSRAELGIADTHSILLDVGGEGRVEGYLVTGFSHAVNLNAVPTGTGTPRVSTQGPDAGAEIPHLVQLQAWDTNPEYPFVDGFADAIAMIGAPLTPTNVREMARVIRDGGHIDLWVSYDDYHDEVRELARLLSSDVEEPGEISAFEHNGKPENLGGTWFVRRRIVARKHR